MNDDPKKTLFDHGPRILMACGSNERAARQVIGRWLKQGHAPQTVLVTLREAQAQQAIDCVSYCQALLKKRIDGAEAFLNGE